jgi:hypothetical protein
MTQRPARGAPFWIALVLTTLAIALLSHRILGIDLIVRKLGLVDFGPRRADLVDGLCIALLMVWVGCHGLLWRTTREPQEDAPGSLRLALAAALACWTLTLAAVPFTSGDLFVYLAHAYTWIEGNANPYLFSPNQIPGNPYPSVMGAWSNSTVPYGPVAILGGVAIRSVGTGLWGELLASRALALACVALSVLCARRIAAATGQGAGREEMLVLACSPLLLVEAGVAAHNEVWASMLLLASAAAALRKRWGLTILLFAASVGIKFVTLVYAPAFAVCFWRSPPAGSRNWLRVALGSALAALAGWGLVAWFGGPRLVLSVFGWAGGFSTKSPVWLASLGVQSLGGGADSVLWVSRVATVALVGWISLGLRQTRDLPDVLIRTTFAYLFLGAAWFQPWYLLPLLLLAPTARERGTRALILVFAASALVGVYGVFFWMRSWSVGAQLAITLLTFGPPSLLLAAKLLRARAARGRPTDPVASMDGA